MKNMKHPVLVAVYPDWHEIERLFVEKRIPAIFVYSKQEFLQLLDPQKVRAFVAISDWIVDDLDAPSLVEQMQGKLPTVIIATQESRRKFGYSIFHKTYFPKLHQYCTAPVDSEELVTRLSQAIDTFNN